MTRNQWIVVGGLMLFILVIFGILLLQMQVPPAASAAPPPSFLLEEAAQAQTVLPIAQEEALRWQPDARLFSAGIVWDDLGPGGILKRDRWTFQFYSPSQRQMAVIRVADGAPQQVRTGLMPNPLPVLPLDQWQVSSAQALQTWWERGGGDFVRQHPQVSIGLTLRLEPGGTRPVWIVAGSATDQHLAILVNSNDGQVLQ